VKTINEELGIFNKAMNWGETAKVKGAGEDSETTIPTSTWNITKNQGHDVIGQGIYEINIAVTGKSTDKYFLKRIHGRA
jgi:hypothetical protein